MRPFVSEEMFCRQQLQRSQQGLDLWHYNLQVDKTLCPIKATPFRIGNYFHFHTTKCAVFAVENPIYRGLFVAFQVFVSLCCQQNFMF